MRWTEAIRLSLGLGDRRLNLEEDRSAVRVPCRVPVSVTGAGVPGVVHGKMVDISATGMRLHLSHALPVGKVIQVVLKSRQAAHHHAGSDPARELSVSGTVVWYRRDRESHTHSVGVEARIAEGHAGEEMLAFLRSELTVSLFEDTQRRKYRRLHVPWAVDVVYSDGTTVRGAIRDLSLCGILFVTVNTFRVNQELSIVVLADSPNIHIPARVVVKRCVLESHQLGWETAGAFMALGDKDRADLTSALLYFLRRHGSD
ncbi:MAG TPA: PilZ domain-containing protein [Candidatus Xenobia bacterium]|jgi:c-di-GMP-binding flagellar brake protein YcgR